MGWATLTPQTLGPRHRREAGPQWGEGLGCALWTGLACRRSDIARAEPPARLLRISNHRSVVSDGVGCCRASRGCGHLSEACVGLLLF